MQAAIARCLAEIAEIESRPDVVAGTVRAFLPVMGIHDWLDEIRLIERGVPDRNEEKP